MISEGLGGFFAAGGPAMILIVLFGLPLISASVVYMVRPDSRRHRLLLSLSLLTLGTGIFGTLLGLVGTMHAVHQFEPKDQLMLIATGIGESLHNLLLACFLLLMVSFFTTIGVFRLSRQSAS